MEHWVKARIQPLSKPDDAGVYGQALQRDKFDSLLLESIDETLGDLLGSRPRDQFYDHLSTRYSYGREEIPQKICEFSDLLDDVFSSGGRAVRSIIIRRLSDKLGYDLKPQAGLEFYDYLDALRARSGRDVDKREWASQTSYNR